MARESEFEVLTATVSPATPASSSGAPQRRATGATGGAGAADAQSSVGIASGSVYHEISLSSVDAARLTEIQFQNYYAAHLCVCQRTTSSWEVILRRKDLMRDPHYEDDAQHWHRIRTSEFSEDYSGGHVRALRIFLFQPSPSWKKFELRNITCYGKKSSVQSTLPPTTAADARSPSSPSHGDVLRLVVEASRAQLRVFHAGTLRLSDSGKEMDRVVLPHEVRSDTGPGSGSR